ncbi:MAG: hypothetical protein OEW19_01125 [Acidobacteriota bacterium]|nr:hypothetical protein [Acidobacteriota bacterium]
MSEPARSDVANRRVVYEIPGQDAVRTRRNVAYQSAGGETLPLDIYELPGSERRAPRPAVIFVTGYNDLGMRKSVGCAAKEMASYASWGRLVAMCRMVGITYECRDPAADARALVGHVTREASSLGINPDRVALWSCSGNVPTALSVLMNVPGLAGAALCYGYLLDLDELTCVADAATTFRFATPAAGRSVSDLPADLPLMLVRAGRDEMPGLNAGLDRFVGHALAHNRPISVINHHSGPHAFDIMDPSPASRVAVRRVLDFLRTTLGA